MSGSKVQTIVRIPFVRANKNLGFATLYELGCSGKCQAMYVWIDGTGEELREKTRTYDEPPKECFFIKFYGPHR